MERLTSWHKGSVRRVDELIQGGVGNELMHGVVGRMDELIHCGGVGGLTSCIASQHGMESGDEKPRIE